MTDPQHSHSRVASHLRDVPQSGIRDFFEIVSTRKDVISLGIGEPDFVTPWHIREASVFALERGATSYTANLGMIGLRRAIADYVASHTGVTYDPQTEILITVGVSEALDLAVRVLLNPGDEIVHHEPSYVSYGPVVTFAHGKPVAVRTRPENGFKPSVDDVAAAIGPRARALLLNFPTNPTGAVLAPDDLQALASLARERDVTVIADDIYSELTYDQTPRSIVSEPGMKARTIYLNGFSKTWAMTGYRVGFACASAELIEAMMKIHQYTMLCAPVLSQHAAIEALKTGMDDSAHMREQYRQRRNYIHAALNEAGLPCHMPGGAFYAFPRIDHLGLTSRDFSLRLLAEENVACVPGTAFGAAGEGYIRCSYATGIEQIKEAVARMRRFVGRLT